MNTDTNTMTTQTALKIRKYWHTLSDLDLAVIAQLTDGDGVAHNLADGRCEIDEDTAQKLADVCRCSYGAAGGFHGFIYYTETREFFAANRAGIIAAIRDQIDQGLWSDDSGAPVSVIGAVMKFNALKGEDPAEIEEAAARALFGPLDDVRAGRLDVIANPCAWGALEDLAYGLDGQEIADADNDSEGGLNMSATLITTPARLIDSEALHLSQYGNPRAKLWLELADGSHVIARTATDAAAGYCVDNWCHAKARGLPWVVITYHITRGGSVIVDYIHEGVGAYAATAADHLIK